MLRMRTQHFRLLDGLRGVAAIAVVVYHFGGRSDLGALMPHGYLAVDFFFALSGLVICHAYRQRLRDQMTVVQFLARRVIRLWPMIIPGTLFAAAIEFWRPGNAPGHLVDVLRSVVLGSLVLPYPFPTSLEQTIFPLNGPVWSLFFELFASVVFVVIARRAKLFWAVPVLIAAGLTGLCWSVTATGTVDSGPYVTDWIGGFARVTYSFFTGVALVSVRRYVPTASAWVYAVALVAVLMTPIGTSSVNSYFEAAVVFVVFPLIVASAANYDPAPLLARVCDGLGEISYPLYTLHYPIVRAICFAMNRFTVPLPGQVAICVATIGGTYVLSVLVSRLYDRPVRLYLTRRLDAARPGPATSEQSTFTSPLGTSLPLNEVT